MFDELWSMLSERGFLIAECWLLLGGKLIVDEQWLMFSEGGWMLNASLMMIGECWLVCDK